MARSKAIRLGIAVSDSSHWATKNTMTAISSCIKMFMLTFQLHEEVYYYLKQVFKPQNE